MSHRLVAEGYIRNGHKTVTYHLEGEPTWKPQLPTSVDEDWDLVRKQEIEQELAYRD